MGRWWNRFVSFATSKPCHGAQRSGSEQRGRNDADAIGPAVGVGAGRDHDGVDHVVSELVLQPPKVAQVVIAHTVGELHLDRDDSVVAALDDEIHLVLTAVGS